MGVYARSVFIKFWFSGGMRLRISRSCYYGVINCVSRVVNIQIVNSCCVTVGLHESKTIQYF